MTTVIFKLGEYRIDLPECLSKLFPLSKGNEVRVHGSWKHKRSKLPPYIIIDLPQSTFSGSGFFNGYSLMFNLKTVQLIKVLQKTSFNYGKNQRQKEIKINKLFSSSEIKSLQPTLIEK